MLDHMAADNDIESAGDDRQIACRRNEVDHRIACNRVSDALCAVAQLVTIENVEVLDAPALHEWRRKRTYLEDLIVRLDQRGEFIPTSD